MRNICLLGTAPGSMHLVPSGNPEWEIWACSPGTYGMPRIDKFFELHRWEPGQPWFSEGYVSWIQNFPGEVIMSAPVPSVKGCKVIEWQRLVKKWGPYNFTSSLAWMCAMAIEAKPDKIAFYGVDMAGTTEYHDQRMGCVHFALEAMKRGIEVGVPPESDLLRPPALYGVCEQSHAWIKQTIRARELASRMKIARDTIAEKQKEEHFLAGALDDQDWQLHSFFGSEDSMDVDHSYTTPRMPEVDMPKGNGEDPDWSFLVPTQAIPSGESAWMAPGLIRANKAVVKKKRGRPRKK